MAPSMTLCRATGRPTAGLTSSRRRASTRRSVAAYASTDEKPNAALLTLSAGALVAQSALIDPAAAAQLAPSQATQDVVATSQVTASPSNKFTSVTAPQVFGDVADQNADVRDIAKDYRDPAGAIQQDKFAGAVKDSSITSSSGLSTPDVDVSGAADSAKSALDSAKAKASNLFSSALPLDPTADLADKGAGVRDISKGYRDPAGAAQQDRFAETAKGKTSPSDLGEAAKSGLKKAQRKATKAFSSVPLTPTADLADLNADVRGEAAGYRDPAGAIQQDTAAGAVKDNLPDLSARKATTPQAKRAGKKVLSRVTQSSRDIGVKASYGKGTRVRDSTGKLIGADEVRGTAPPPGNARLSQPLVRDSFGAKRPGSKNQFGAAGGEDRRGIKAVQQVVDRVAN